MAAIGKNSKDDKATQILGESPEEILQRKRALENRVGMNAPQESAEPEKTGMAAEKAVGALCYLPKSIHRLASRAAEDRDITAKRFFLELILQGLAQHGVITKEQYDEAFGLPFEYGWQGRKKQQ